NNAVFTSSSFTSTITGFVNGETASVVTNSPTYTGTGTTGTAAGTYVITPVVSALTATNYSFAAANGALAINKAVLTITPQNKTRTYDGLVQGGGQAGTPYLTDSPYTLSSGGTNPYIITKDLGQNWSFQADFKLNSSNGFSTWFSYGHYSDGILLRHLRGDGFYLKGNNAVMSPDVFGGTTTNGAYVNVRVTYSTTGTTGTMKVYVSGVLKWTLTTTGALSPADKTIRIGSAHHANNEGLDGAVKNIIISDGSANYSYAVTGLATGDASSVITGDVAYSGPATSAVNIGNYSFSSVVTALTASNYTFVPGADATLTINRATLTVTADAKSKTYDNAVFTNAQYSSTITGYQGSDTGSVITGVPTYSGTAMAATAAGSYTITSGVGGMSATNYTFASANGTLTINKAVLTVTPNPFVKTYDSTAVGSTGISPNATNAFKKATATIITGSGSFSISAGLATDGTKLFVSDGSTIKTVSFAGALLGSNSVSNLGSTQCSLAYAKGYLFARNLNSLYRINTSTWTSTLVTVDSSHPLVTASGWMTYNIFETPSGQIGSIAPAPNPVVKLYNVSSDGLTLTFARSVTLSDTWAPDEHGTASDGTYLYRLSCNAGYKVYSLATGAVVYDGSSATTGWSLTNADSGGNMSNT
ncbi:MAG: hypothetical protein EBS30_16080, partial [Planctomycetes bacterium]|nr:hypothetical protein [Planctomycetota bacterium]